MLKGAYCHVCGEKVLGPEDLRVGTFMRRAAGAAFDADSRLWRTYRKLLFRPGFLTAEFVRGRREPYVHPLQTFLLANVVFFLMLSTFGGFGTFTTRLEWHIGQPLYGDVARQLVEQRVEPGTAEANAYAVRFDEATPRYANSMVILVVPILAAGLALLYLRRRVPFVQHLVFALHFMAFLLLFTTIMPYALWLIMQVPGTGFLDGEGPISVLLLLAFSWYFALAMRRAYGDGRLASLVRGLAATVVLFISVILYRGILFLAVYFTLD